ncbi:hypothetical protein BHE74_00020444 [Ensete ventricosum]|nr:hypothetical protein BHE74_00020444 [Ensete ventricosum]
MEVAQLKHGDFDKSSNLIKHGYLTRSRSVGPGVFGKAHTARYIPVRQLTDTRTGRYQAKSTVSGRLRKKKERRRGKEEEEEEEEKYLAPPGGRPRSVAARVALATSPPAGSFLPMRAVHTDPSGYRYADRPLPDGTAKN